MTKERPIIFSGDMVRAILDGRKIQTRRVITSIKGMKEFIDRDKNIYSIQEALSEIIWAPDQWLQFCPHGQPGDRLWVRENFWIEHDSDYTSHDWGKLVDCGINLAEDDWATVWYCATEDEPDGKTQFYSKRPSIHMPRWASRITLEITDIRVEQLQDISWSDCLAEGIERLRSFSTFGADESELNDLYQFQFKQLWDSINAKRGYSWDTNPWVWSISFRRI